MTWSRLSTRGAYEGLLASRKLPKPSGKPLYEYRFTREEFDSLAAVLRSTRGGFLDEPWGMALFVAFAAEWFRREREGGHWDWVHPLAALGVHYHATDPRAPVRYGHVRAAVEGGLRIWGREQRRGIKILHAVIAESGFPAAAIRQGPRFATWLKRSVLAVEAGFTPEEAVASEAWRAPDSLVQALFDPALALCRAIVELRSDLPTSGPADAVQHLDAARPGWRAELPFDLEERDVRRLVEDLVRVRREGASGLAVVRRLRRAEAGWSAWAELQLSSTFDHEKLPPSLRRLLQDSQRVRIRAGGALAEFGRAIAVLERVRDENCDQWQVRPLVQGFDVRLPFNEELRLQVLAGDEQLAEFTAFGGEPLDASVVVLQSVDHGAPADSNELEVIGASPVRTPRPWLALCAEEAAVGRIRFERDPIDLGPVQGQRRRVLAFEGYAELEIEGEKLVWRSLDERLRALRLNLVGDTIPRIKESVFRGCPQPWLVDDGQEQVVPKRELIWRALGSAVWAAAAETPPLGRVEFAVRRKGELVAWTRAEVAPHAFGMIADVRKRLLRVSGLAGAQLGAAGPRHLPTRRTGDEAIIDLSDHPRGAAVRIGLRWVNRIDITLPDPVTDPVLLDPENKPVTHARLSISRVSGFRLLSPNPSTLLLELRRKGGSIAHATRRVEGLVPMVAVGEQISQLLGGCEELDACVRLTWMGEGDWIAEVGWYDLDQALTVDVASSPFAILRSAVSPALVAFSLAGPASGLAKPPFAPRAETSDWLHEQLGPGPWLLAGSMSDGRRLRPKVLTGVPTVGDEGRLHSAVLAATRQLRDEALDSCFAAPGEVVLTELRQLVDLSTNASMSETPYAAVDPLRALARAPAVAVRVLAECTSLAERQAVLRLQSELPMLWCATPVAEWIGAFGARRARLAKKLEEMGDLIGPADASVANALAQIVDLQPALRVHAQGAFLLAGLSGTDPVIAERLCRPAATDLSQLAQDLVRRRGDGPAPPSGLGLAVATPDARQLWQRYDPIYADVIAAPILVAKIALCRSDRKLLSGCRTAWLYDREYFENGVLCALLQLAQSEAPVPA